MRKKAIVGADLAAQRRGVSVNDEMDENARMRMDVQGPALTLHSAYLLLSPGENRRAPKYPKDVFVTYYKDPRNLLASRRQLKVPD